VTPLSVTDLHLKTRDSAIAASFHSNPAEGQEPALKTSFGINQEIISIPVKFSSSSRDGFIRNLGVDAVLNANGGKASQC
jgi:hypothetical protein